MLYMKNWHICPKPVSLGFEGDNLAHRLEISTDLTEPWEIRLEVEKDGKKNIILLSENDGVYSVLLTASMLWEDGQYIFQLRGTLGDLKRHSNIFYGFVQRSINAAGAYPPLSPSEFEQIEQRLTDLNNNPPKPGENGYWLIYDPDSGEYEESDVPLPAGGSGLPEITPDDDGKLLGVLDGEAAWVLGGSGGGNVSSPDIAKIRVLDRQEYDDLPVKDKATLYFIRG